MRIVELLPGLPHLILVPQFRGGWSATKLDESRIRAVSKIQEPGVDPPKLPRVRDRHEPLSGVEQEVCASVAYA
jgi:hypothetical protein